MISLGDFPVSNATVYFLFLFSALGIGRYSVRVVEAAAGRCKKRVMSGCGVRGITPVPTEKMREVKKGGESCDGVAWSGGWKVAFVGGAS